MINLENTKKLILSRITKRINDGELDQIILDFIQKENKELLIEFRFWNLEIKK